ncbi:MAG: hypothetical protein WAO00_19735 [Chthoniobacterales bacterium]
MKIPHFKIALLIAGALTLHASTTWAATCSVPTLAYPTIQSAVNDPVCTTINVAPGVYTENVMIGRSLTLNGAQPGQTVALRTPGGAAESTLQGANPTGSMPVILINATNVTVDGFTIRNLVTANAATAIDIKGISNDALIRYNIFDGISTLETGPTSYAQAIFLESGPLRIEIGQNKIQNITASQSARGILIADGDTPGPTDNVFIHDNTITGITTTGGGALGLLVTTTTVTSSFRFSSNDLSNLEGATLVHGVSLESDTPGAIVQQNNFTNLIGPATDNVAVYFANNPSTFAPGPAVQNNNFNLTIMSYGIAIQPGLPPFDEPLDGQCNWWGSPDGPGPVGPGSGARVSPDVAYSPWAIAPGVGTAFICTGNNVPTTEAQCKNGGWTRTVHADGTPFTNQGDCIQYVNNGH